MLMLRLCVMYSKELNNKIDLGHVSVHSTLIDENDQ